MGEEASYVWKQPLSDAVVARLTGEIRNDPAWYLFDHYLELDYFRFHPRVPRPTNWPDFSVKLDATSLYFVMYQATGDQWQYLFAAFALLLRREDIEFEFEEP